jgi:hypothetical protein
MQKIRVPNQITAAQCKPTKRPKSCSTKYPCCDTSRAYIGAMALSPKATGKQKVTAEQEEIERRRIGRHSVIPSVPNDSHTARPSFVGGFPARETSAFSIARIEGRTESVGNGRIIMKDFQNTIASIKRRPSLDEAHPYSSG